MSGFTEAEVQAIAKAAALGPQAGVDRLTEVFGAGTLRLARAVKLADQVRAGEAVNIGGGEYLARDAPASGGWVLGRVEVEGS